MKNIERAKEIEIELGSALILAVKKGKSEEVGNLLKRGANINYLDHKDRKPPVYHAFAGGHYDLGDQLIKEGAKVSRAISKEVQDCLKQSGEVKIEYIRSDVKNFILEFALGLKVNTSITGLDFSGFSFRDVNLDLILRAIKKNTNIISLNFPRVSAMELASFIKENNSVTSIKGINVLEDRDFELLAEALAVNTTISHISLGSMSNRQYHYSAYSDRGEENRQVKVRNSVIDTVLYNSTLLSLDSKIQDRFDASTINFGAKLRSNLISTIKAANNGNVDAAWRLALYCAGKFDREERALKYLIMAADGGNIHAVKVASNLFKNGSYSLNGKTFEVGIDFIRSRQYEASYSKLKKELDKNVIQQNQSNRRVTNLYQLSELISAAKDGDIKKVINLLEQGENINEVSNEGKSAVYYALVGEHFELVDELIRRGANVFVSISEDLKVALLNSQDIKIGDDYNPDYNSFKIDELALVLKANADIKSLAIRGYRIKIGDKEMRCLAEALKSHPYITKLDTGPHSLGDKEVGILIDVLKSSPSITDLKFCGLEAPRMKILCDAINYNNIVDRLCLSGISQNEQIVILADFLKVNKSVTTLNISGDATKITNFPILTDAIKLNSSLVNLEIVMQRLNDQDKDAIVSATLDNTNILFVESYTSSYYGRDDLLDKNPKIIEQLKKNLLNTIQEADQGDANAAWRLANYYDRSIQDYYSVGRGEHYVRKEPFDYVIKAAEGSNIYATKRAIDYYQLIGSNKLCFIDIPTYEMINQLGKYKVKYEGLRKEFEINRDKQRIINVTNIDSGSSMLKPDLQGKAESFENKAVEKPRIQKVQMKKNETNSGRAEVTDIKPNVIVDLVDQVEKILTKQYEKNSVNRQIYFKNILKLEMISVFGKCKIKRDKVPFEDEKYSLMYGLKLDNIFNKIEISRITKYFNSKYIPEEEPNSDFINRNLEIIADKLSRLYQNQLKKLDVKELQDLSKVMIFNMLECIVNNNKVAQDLSEMVELGESNILQERFIRSAEMPEQYAKAIEIIENCGVKLEDGSIYLRGGNKDIGSYGLRNVSSSEWNAAKLQRLKLKYVKKDTSLNLIDSDEEEEMLEARPIARAAKKTTDTSLNTNLENEVRKLKAEREKEKLEREKEKAEAAKKEADREKQMEDMQNMLRMLVGNNISGQTKTSESNNGTQRLSEIERKKEEKRRGEGYGV